MKKRYGRLLLGGIAFVAILFASLLTVSNVTAMAEDGARMILEQSLTSTATVSGSGVYRAISAGDTFTLVYRLVENDGMIEGAFTPAYDETRFALTSFSADERYWTMLNDYGHEVTDPDTGITSFVPMTAAEFIAEHNLAREENRAPYTDRLSFFLSFAGARGEERATSDHFITVVYTAFVDMIAPLDGTPVFSFGFYTDDAVTSAAHSPEEEMEILFRTGEGAPKAISNEMISISVLAEVSAFIPVGQTVLLTYDEATASCSFDESEIELIYTSPIFTAGDPNPYLLDGGVLAYRYYRRDPSTGDLTLSVVPTEEDLENVFVSVRFSDTLHYEGCETQPVQVDFAEPRYTFRFRAQCAAASLDPDTAIPLSWDVSTGDFLPAATSESYSFRKGQEIPHTVMIADFRVNRWWKAVRDANGYYVYSLATVFDIEASLEESVGSLYLAEMTLALGRGDVNGDDAVTATDVLMMKRYLVGANYRALTEEADAWAYVTAGTMGTDVLCPEAWDANGDGNRDARDIVAICEALATGYAYRVVRNSTVDGAYSSGEQIARTDSDVRAGEYVFLHAGTNPNGALLAGKKVVFAEDIIIENGGIYVYDSAVWIDLNGHSFTAEAVSITASHGVTIRNGALMIPDLTIRSPKGVYLTDVTDCYGEPLVANGETSIRRES